MPDRVPARERWRCRLRGSLQIVPSTLPLENEVTRLPDECYERITFRLLFRRDRANYRGNPRHQGGERQQEEECKRQNCGCAPEMAWNRAPGSGAKDTPEREQQRAQKDSG